MKKEVYLYSFSKMKGISESLRKISKNKLYSMLHIYSIPPYPPLWASVSESKTMTYTMLQVIRLTTTNSGLGSTARCPRRKTTHGR